MATAACYRSASHPALRILASASFAPVELRLDHFRNPNSVARKTADIATNRPGYSGVPTKGGAPTRRMIDKFLADPALMQQIAQAIRDGVHDGDFALLTASVEDEEYGAPEGSLLVRRHVAYERNKSPRRPEAAGGTPSWQGAGMRGLRLRLRADIWRAGRGLHRVPSHFAAAYQVIQGHEAARPCAAV